ncbi:hypothetical protein PHAVU_010G039500 [Phaseolus vulgaris]|uniref:Uncharacterized protein n=1 Tax=Phaseolus vulgaris TaxID=3885 RepID=V7AQ45_PHAVU|nr:hypothetical protein PHAVU_010G039500g [Phaseolus vulgaris]ESW06336.1 hypothetical protein PHAVU_010G039500g [Phaseolus vulgaris]
MNQAKNLSSFSSSRMSLTPLFLRAFITAQTLVWFLNPFFPTSLPMPSTLSLLANTSPTTVAALALQDLPHSSDSLMVCSAVDDVATIRPLLLSTTFAVIYFNDMNSLRTYRFITGIFNCLIEDGKPSMKISLIKTKQHQI